jgi:hypothetical protein
VLIFRSLINKGGSCTAKVTFANKESVAAAIAEYNSKQYFSKYLRHLIFIFCLDKHIPQWNTKIWVSKFVSDPNRKKSKDVAQGKNGKY